MINLRKFLLIVMGLCFTTPLLAFRFQPQVTIYTGGEQDGSTACSASLSDFSGSTDAVADLTCANTRALEIAAFNQVSITLQFVRVAGTAVVMQCDISMQDSDATATAPKLWGPIMTEDSAGTKDVRTWTATTSVSGVITHNFEVNAKWIRCRYWVTGGTTDTIKAIVRKAAEVQEGR